MMILYLAIETHRNINFIKHTESDCLTVYTRLNSIYQIFTTWSMEKPMSQVIKGVGDTKMSNSTFNEPTYTSKVQR